MICIVPVSPMRSEPAHQHEIVSQLLFGEGVERIEESKNGWVKVKCFFDDYEGWVTKTHLLETQDQEKFTETMAGDWINIIQQNELPMYIPFGATIPSTPIISTGNYQWDFTAVKRLTIQPFTKESLLAISNIFLNTSYMWGGRSVFGIDCSGFVQQVFKHFGINIPRDAHLQAEKGDTLGFLQEARTGDLAFFDDVNGQIIHVGILLNDHQIIHASGKVRIDLIDNQGIINSDTKLYTHQLRTIKRIAAVKNDYFV